MDKATLRQHKTLVEEKIGQQKLKIPIFLKIETLYLLSPTRIVTQRHSLCNLKIGNESKNMNRPTYAI